MRKLLLFISLFFAMAITTKAEGFEQQITGITVVNAENAPVSPDCTGGVVKVATCNLCSLRTGVKCISIALVPVNL